ncbi:precorrin-2 dehydrogenase/sirohydrochlorin ferrochelatase [Oikeobacillus pervagus]|uniref:precorrin-2 dehydrogenase n=1 Tax=Oikeobacillus pervagus TaxID=1325931 RepID=A0AAJ1T774_9BACI|nr:NAD(P)-binding protein [Oikeobacillus pervagus]MDQ0215870.1 precorrin-2 dehydrogenase/sirohydrochlorin ferrochelatase [Oikeobacillus pervagus]
MYPYYPIMINLQEKKVVVVGGGKVAERKVLHLIESHADVTVVSPNMTKTLRVMSEQHQITWLRKYFEEDDLRDAVLVFAATNDSEINEKVRKSAQPQQFVNVVDQPKKSDFHVPSMVRKGRLNIAISTTGASPILAKIIKKDLESKYGEEYEEYLDFLYEARQQIILEVKDSAMKRQLLSAIASPEFLESDQRNERLRQLLNHELEK